MACFTIFCPLRGQSNPLSRHLQLHCPPPGTYDFLLGPLLFQQSIWVPLHPFPCHQTPILPQGCQAPGWGTFFIPEQCHCRSPPLISSLTPGQFIPSSSNSTPAQCVETQPINNLRALTCNSTTHFGTFSHFSYLLGGSCSCLLTFLHFGVHFGVHFGSCYQGTRPESPPSVTYFWSWEGPTIRAHTFVCLPLVCSHLLMLICQVQPISFHAVRHIGLVFFPISGVSCFLPLLAMWSIRTVLHFGLWLSSH